MSTDALRAALRPPARRLLLLALAVGLLGVLPVTISPASAATLPGLEGTGSTTDPIVLDSVADLDAVTAAINGNAATYGSLSYRLDADLDYGGATYAGIAAFSGFFDGAGHTIGNLVYDNAANSVAFFRKLTGATVRDLTLTDVTGATRDGAGSAAVLAADAANATITGITVIGASIRITPVGATVNTQAAGLVAGATGGTRITDNLVWDVDVSGRKYAAGVVAYPRSGGQVARNLLVDVDVIADSPGGASIAAMLVAQLQTSPAAGGVDVSGNIVLRGSAGGEAAQTYAAGIASMAGAVQNLVSTATTFKTGTVAGAMGTPTAPADLVDPATYTGLGWDFTAETGAWRWVDALRHPVLRAAALPTYELTYDLDGGRADIENPASYTLGGAAITLVNPTRAGYQFAGWTGTGQTAPTLVLTLPPGATGDRSYQARWTPASYGVSYDLAGGTVDGTNPTTYDVESAAFTLLNPTREGYPFAGWTGTDLTGPAQTVTVPAGSTGPRAYTATWHAPLGYTVTYDLAGGVVAGANRSAYDIESAAFTLIDPTRAGYTFAGWTGTGLAGPTRTVTVASGSTGDRGYTATWTPVGFAVTYDPAGGRLPDGNRTGYTIESAAFTLVNPTRAGYTFAGWTGTGLTGPVTTVTVQTGSTGHRGYAATWTPIAYPITYDLSGGTATGNPATYDIESAAFTLADPTRPGHAFAGWLGTDLPAATTTVTVETGSTGARSYVATWTQVPLARAATTVRLSVVTRAKGTRLARPRHALLSVASAGGPAPRGTVVLTARGRAGQRRVTLTRTVRLGAAPTKVRLPAGLKPGRWKLTATYAGDATHLGSTSRPVALRVARPKN